MNEGDRLELMVKCVDKKPGIGYLGREITLCYLEGEDARYIWPATTPPDWLLLGERTQVRATVKKCGDHITYLTRVVPL